MAVARDEFPAHPPDLRQLPGGVVYLMTGVDLTASEGIDVRHARTLASELVSDFSKWPTVKHCTSSRSRRPQLARPFFPFLLDRHS